MTLRANSGKGFRSLLLSFHCLCHHFHFLKLHHPLWIHRYICDCEVFPECISNTYFNVVGQLEKDHIELRTSYTTMIFHHKMSSLKS